VNGWQGIIAQLIQFVLCIIIYIPFMRLQDKAALAEEKNLQTQAAVVE
jgi:PTS system cellobiose-specific IIC component